MIGKDEQGILRTTLHTSLYLNRKKYILVYVPHPFLQKREIIKIRFCRPNLYIVPSICHTITKHFSKSRHTLGSKKIWMDEKNDIHVRDRFKDNIFSFGTCFPALK